jgi:hypothetical protein
MEVSQLLTVGLHNDFRAGANRFQMIETRLGTSSTDSQSWDRGALIFYYSNKARTAYQPFSNQDDNNGNVSMAEHYVPVTVSGGTVTSYAVAQRDRYEYDALNRIQSVVSEQILNHAFQLTIPPRSEYPRRAILCPVRLWSV